jgi:cytochrome c553
MKRQFYFVFLALTLGIPALAVADVDALMEGCNGCHGDNGVSQSSDVPTIAGIPEFVHVDALYIYQDEARPCAESEYRHGDTSRPATTMCAVAADLSEDDIDALAAAYSALPTAVTRKPGPIRKTKPACWVASKWATCAIHSLFTWMDHVSSQAR